MPSTRLSIFGKEVFAEGKDLNDVYSIYGAGALFERLLLEARQQLDDTILHLSYERKGREFEKALDAQNDDYYFFKGYSELQAALMDIEKRLDKANKALSGDDKLRSVRANKKCKSWRINFK